MMAHRWKPCPRRLGERIEVCQRPGCVAERRAYGAGTNFEHRPNEQAAWDRLILPRCTGGSLERPRKRRVDKGDEL